MRHLEQTSHQATAPVHSESKWGALTVKRAFQHFSARFGRMNVWRE